MKSFHDEMSINSNQILPSIPGATVDEAPVPATSLLFQKREAQSLDQAALSTFAHKSQSSVGS